MLIDWHWLKGEIKLLCLFYSLDDLFYLGIVIAFELTLKELQSWIDGKGYPRLFSFKKVSMVLMSTRDWLQLAWMVVIVKDVCAEAHAHGLYSRYGREKVFKHAYKAKRDSP
jgi:hypothetical protein